MTDTRIDFYDTILTEIESSIDDGTARQIDAELAVMEQMRRRRATALEDTPDADAFADGFREAVAIRLWADPDLSASDVSYEVFLDLLDDAGCEEYFPIEDAVMPLEGARTSDAVLKLISIEVLREIMFNRIGVVSVDASVTPMEGAARNMTSATRTIVLNRLATDPGIHYLGGFDRSMIRETVDEVLHLALGPNDVRDAHFASMLRNRLQTGESTKRAFPEIPQDHPLAIQDGSSQGLKEVADVIAAYAGRGSDDQTRLTIAAALASARAGCWMGSPYTETIPQIAVIDGQSATAKAYGILSAIRFYARDGNDMEIMPDVELIAEMVKADTANDYLTPNNLPAVQHHMLHAWEAITRLIGMSEDVLDEIGATNEHILDEMLHGGIEEITAILGDAVNEPFPAADAELRIGALQIVTAKLSEAAIRRCERQAATLTTEEMSPTTTGWYWPVVDEMPLKDVRKVLKAFADITGVDMAIAYLDGQGPQRIIIHDGRSASLLTIDPEGERPASA